MSKDRTKKGLLRKGVCCVSAVAVASLMVVPIASAADDMKWPVPKVEKDLGNYVTDGVHNANEPTGDIIGVSRTCGNNKNVSYNLADVETDAQIGVYGSSANVNANPYVWNYFYNCYATTYGFTRTDNQLHFSTQGGGPSSAYTDVIEEYGTCADLSWRPDLLIGLNGSYDETAYPGEAGKQLAEARTWGGYTERILEIRTWTNDSQGGIPTDVPDSDKSLYTTENDVLYNQDGNPVVYSEYYKDGDWDYSPKGVAYEIDTFNNFLDTLYTMATETETLVTDEGKDVRYGDPMAIAYKFEMYAKATKWYILSQLGDGAGQTQKKKVAYVSGIDTDTAAVSLTSLTEDAVVEESNIGRIAQGIEGTVEDASWTLTPSYTAESSGGGGPGGGGGGGGGGTTTTNYYYVSQLADVDVIFASNVSTMEELMAQVDGFDGVIYSQSTPSGTYGLTANSIESIMLAGQYQGLIYPELINPVGIICYYFTEFYHLDTAFLQDALTLNCTGLNLPSGYEWVVDGNYDYSELTSKLDAGVKFYFENASDFVATGAGTESDPLTSKYSVNLQASEAMATAYGDDEDAHTAFFKAVDEPSDSTVPEGSNPTASADDLQSQLDKILGDLEEAKSEVSDLQDQVDNLAGQNEELQTAYEEIQSQLDSILESLGALEQQLIDAQQQAADANAATEAAKQQTEEIQQQLTAAETQISDLQKQNEELQKQASQAGSGKSGSNLKSQTIKTTTYKSFKAKKIKKKKQSFKVAKASGKITVKKGKGSKKLKVSKTGKITAKKGLKKGTYTVNVTINAAATSTYAAALIVTLTV